MKKIIFNLIQIIIGTILIFSIVIVVFPLLPPFRGFYHTRTVLTGSMEPSIRKGAVVINKWVQDKDVKKGDIVTFQKPTDRNVFITHRIQKVEKTTPLYRFQTKGDVNEATDFWEITQANIEGKVIFTIPFLGYLIEFFKTPIGFILIVVLPLLVFIIKEVFQAKGIYQKIKTGDQKEQKKNMKTKGKIILTIAIITSFLSFQIQGTFASFSSEAVFMVGVSLQTAATFPSTEGRVVINEVYYDGDSNNEWIELYNAGGQAVDLNGWSITDNNSSDTIVSASLLLQPDNFAVIVGSNNSGQTIASGAIKIVLGDTAIGSGLNNDGDRLILKDNGTNTIDQMSYGNDNSVWDPDCPTVVSGHSLARSPKGYDTDQPSDFVDLDTPNPGTNPHPPEENEEVEGLEESAPEQDDAELVEENPEVLSEDETVNEEVGGAGGDEGGEEVAEGPVEEEEIVPEDEEEVVDEKEVTEPSGEMDEPIVDQPDGGQAEEDEKQQEDTEPQDAKPEEEQEVVVEDGSEESDEQDQPPADESQEEPQSEEQPQEEAPTELTDEIDE